MKNFEKYQIGYYEAPKTDMKWMHRDRITEAPIWCSVDLRDGNQALVVPMHIDEKIEYFQFLVDLGFKEIEVGFPAASQTEYNFIRRLIEENMIPDDVTIQVLTQAREHIIEKTFDSIKGAKKAIVHLYNSTSYAQREQVFKMSKAEIVKIAQEGAEMFNRMKETMPETQLTFQYSPESFTGTEPEFALEVCNAVIDIWQPTAESKMIINLPATVSMSMPHVYANQIEYMSDNLHRRENVIVSLHPHNDRGTGVADAELGILAGADRIEGTLFGNGERTGNVDLITLAMNLYSHGVNPKLNFSNMQEVVEVYEKFTDIKVGPRHPYAGQLVFAAFSGSHQDAIAKGMDWRAKNDLDQWTVPYLPIDPKDVGREYETDVIRINSQSGKGGIAYILEHNYGYDIPKKMREDVGYFVKNVSDESNKELAPEEIFEIFKKEYINDFSPVDITDAIFRRVSDFKSEDGMKVEMRVLIAGEEYELTASGNGRLDAVSKALQTTPYQFDYTFLTYSEHALSSDSDSKAVSYIAIEDNQGRTFWGVGIHSDIILSSVNALVSAINRMNKVNPIKKFEGA